MDLISLFRGSLFRGTHDPTNVSANVSAIGIASTWWFAATDLRAGADTHNFNIRFETSKVVKNCLKSTIVTEISRTKVSEKSDLLSLPFAVFQIVPFAVFHIVLPEVSEVRARKLH